VLTQMRHTWRTTSKKPDLWRANRLILIVNLLVAGARNQLYLLFTAEGLETFLAQESRPLSGVDR